MMFNVIRNNTQCWSKRAGALKLGLTFDRAMTELSGQEFDQQRREDKQDANQPSTTHN